MTNLDKFDQNFDQNLTALIKKWQFRSEFDITGKEEEERQKSDH